MNRTFLISILALTLSLLLTACRGEIMSIREACLLLTGCGYAFGGYRMAGSSMRYEQLENNGWRIFPARENEWRRRGTTRLGFAEYFPENDIRNLHEKEFYNYFHAFHTLENGRNIAAWIEYVGAFRLTKMVPVNLNGTPIGEKIWFDDNSSRCVETKTIGIVATFNAVDVVFDSASLYLLSNGERIDGTEVTGIPAWLARPVIRHEHALYNLASWEIIRNKQPYVNRPKNDPTYKPQSYPTFYYQFPMSCADLENAILVIDGLYEQGKRLPPLKVRLNYIDFSKVPQYAGTGATQGGQ